MNQPLWQPSSERIASANLTDFADRVAGRHGQALRQYPALRAWSVEQPDAFWAEVWRYADVRASRGWDAILVDGERMPGARWFTGARLNFAENLLRHRDDHPAMIAISEDGRRRTLTYAELYDRVARLAAALKADGVGPGDRVAAVMPHLPETIIAMLATTALGAIWSSCSPDFGVQGVLDRFGQIEPKVLITVDGYRYNGKPIDVRPKLAEIAARLPSLRAHRDGALPGRGQRSGAARRRRPRARLSRRDAARVRPAAVRPPDLRPLLVRHHRRAQGDRARRRRHAAAASQGADAAHRPQARGPDLLLHDLRLDDVELAGQLARRRRDARAVRGLAVPSRRQPPVRARRERAHQHFRHQRQIHRCGQEGRPGAGQPGTTWRRCARSCRPARRSCRKASTSSTAASRRTCISPRSRAAPTSSRASCSATRSRRSGAARSRPAASGWRSRSGTTRAGRSCGEPGELVCVKPFPSMPVSFWNDPDGSRYRAAYFERFPGVWTHGDRDRADRT